MIDPENRIIEVWKKSDPADPGEIARLIGANESDFVHYFIGCNKDGWSRYLLHDFTQCFDLHIQSSLPQHFCSFNHLSTINHLVMLILFIHEYLFISHPLEI